MLELRFERRVDAAAERVFDVLSGLATYQEWLPPSDAFVGMKLREEGPIRQGSTYLDITTAGAARGEVTVLDRPHRPGSGEQGSDREGTGSIRARFASRSTLYYNDYRRLHS